MNTKEVSYVGEIWKDIKDYEDEYEVSNLGRVRNKKTKRILKPHKDTKGYYQYFLYKEGKRSVYSAHRLVYEAFIGKIPEGFQVNHINEDKTDNRLENLNLMTCKENVNWGTGIERRAKSQTNHPKRSKSIVQKSLDGKIIRIWPSLMEIHRELGYTNTLISACCRGGFFSKSRGKWVNLTKAYNYLWEYEKAAS